MKRILLCEASIFKLQHQRHTGFLSALNSPHFCPNVKVIQFSVSSYISAAIIITTQSIMP
jgi:hypothetical protein